MLEDVLRMQLEAALQFYPCEQALCSSARACGIMIRMSTCFEGHVLVGRRMNFRCGLSDQNGITSAGSGMAQGQNLLFWPNLWRPASTRTS
jgi:hypothetical protein